MYVIYSLSIDLSGPGLRSRYPGPPDLRPDLTCVFSGTPWPERSGPGLRSRGSSQVRTSGDDSCGKILGKEAVLRINLNLDGTSITSQLNWMHILTYRTRKDDGWVCDVEVIGVPSRLRLIRKSGTLAKIKLTRDLNIEEKTARRKWKNPPLVDCENWTPEVAKKRSVSRWSCKNKILINSLCNLSDVLTITGKNETELRGLLSPANSSA